MPSLLIRNVDPALRARLKDRAARHGLSMEAAAREMLERGLQTPPAERLDLVVLAQSLFGPLGGVDLPPIHRRVEQEPPDFSGPEYDQRGE